MPEGVACFGIERFDGGEESFHFLPPAIVLVGAAPDLLRVALLFRQAGDVGFVNET